MARDDQPIILRPALLAFAKAMELKLQANDHKSYQEAHVLDLFVGLYGEVCELREAITNGEPPARILDEAVDVANYAMMLFDEANKVPTGEKRVVTA